MNRNASALAAAITATLGSAAAADAAVVTATLKVDASYSGNGSSAGDFSSGTATWEYDTVTGVMSQTGGLFNVRFTIVPTTTLFRHSATGLVIGNGAAATATDYSCKEGNFGPGVGAALCGNYNFGVNSANNSSTTWGPGTAFARTIGGDDMALGPQQSVAAFDAFTQLSWVGTTLTLSNAVCNPAAPGNASGCATTGGFNSGYQWIFDATQSSGPAVVNDTASTTRNAAIPIAVLANDTGLTDPVTVTVTDGTIGTTVVNGSGGPASGVTVTYTPNLAAGTPTQDDTFTYTITSESPALTGTVTVTVNNIVPNAQGAPGVSISTQGVAPDTTSGTFTAPGTGGSLGNTPSTVSVIAQGSQGTATESNGTITYTPSATFFEGTDTFDYQITDADTPTGETSTATVTVTIPDLIPALSGGSGETGIDEPEEFDLTSGLTAGNGSLAQHSFAVVSDGSNGSCTLENTTTLVYTPDAGFIGSDSCDVSITDGDGSSSSATYDIEVAAAGGFRNGNGGSSSADWLILSLLGGSALIRRRRKA